MSEITGRVFRYLSCSRSLLFSLLALANPYASADTAISLNADRPSFAESPGTVPPRSLQLEGGVKYVKIESGIEKLTVGQFKMRLGWLQDFEFRILWDGYEDQKSDGADFADPDLQLKWRFTPDRSLGFRAALLGGLSLPLGDSAAVEPKVGFAWNYGRAEGIQPYGTFDLSYPEENGERLYALEPSIGIEYGFGQTALFLSYFGLLKESRAPLHSIDFGITHLINEKLQVDLEIGVGVNDRADVFGLSTGFVRRW